MLPSKKDAYAILNRCLKKNPPLTQGEEYAFARALYELNKTFTDTATGCVDEVVKHANETYDKFLITCLEPYGFTEENAAEEANRVVIYEKKWDPSGNTYRYVYVDGVYAFTIRMNQAYDHDDGSYKTTITYEKIVEEHRKGERAV